jgi:hypothetical protein
MKCAQRFSSLLAAAIVASWAGSARAQLDLPRPSPTAKVMQRVGLTDITIDYSSPGVKGRKVWGGLVPYDVMWRAGANSATKLTVSKDVSICDKSVSAGSYALFFIPGAKGWTLVLNKDAEQSGTGAQYKQDLDVLRCPLKTSAIAMRERMIFTFSNTTDDAASLDLEWEKLKVSIPIKVATEQQALANIKNATENGWRMYANAARYLLDSKKDYDAGLALVNQSLALHEDWYNDFIKAELLAAKGNYKEAYPLAEKSQDLGSKAAQFFMEADVKKALVDWKSKK